MSAIPCGLMGLYKDYWFILSVMFMFILCLFSGGGSANLWLVGVFLMFLGFLRVAFLCEATLVN